MRTGDATRMQEASDGSRRRTIGESAARPVAVRGGHPGAGDGVPCRRMRGHTPTTVRVRRDRPAQRARGRSSAPPQPLRTGERFLDLSAAAVREQDAKTP